MGRLQRSIRNLIFLTIGATLSSSLFAYTKSEADTLLSRMIEMGYRPSIAKRLLKERPDLGDEILSELKTQPGIEARKSFYAPITVYRVIAIDPKDYRTEKTTRYYESDGIWYSKSLEYSWSYVIDGTLDDTQLENLRSNKKGTGFFGVATESQIPFIWQYGGKTEDIKVLLRENGLDPTSNHYSVTGNSIFQVSESKLKDEGVFISRIGSQNLSKSNPQIRTVEELSWVDFEDCRLKDRIGVQKFAKQALALDTGRCVVKEVEVQVHTGK